MYSRVFKKFTDYFSLFAVDHLIKYLAVRLALEPEPGAPDQLTFCIYVSPNPGSPGQFVMVGGSSTLYQILEKFWRVNKPVEMYYTWKGNKLPSMSSD